VPYSAFFGEKNFNVIKMHGTRIKKDKIFIIILSRIETVFWRKEGNLCLILINNFDIFLAEFIILSD
jgi:hypothetical protein